MRQRLAGIAALTLGFVGCCEEKQDARALVDLATIKEIRIDYRHMGWGSVEEQFIIVPAARGEGFVLHGLYVDEARRKVEVEDIVLPQALQAFLEEIAAPGWTRPKGIQVLAQRVDRAKLRRFEPVISTSQARCTYGELQQLARLHLGRTHVVDMVDDYYGHGISWTDDYPLSTVQIQRQNEPMFTMSSQSQKAMMLPWNIGMPTNSASARGENWSLPLSRSLQELLPPSSRLYERLDGIAWMQRQLEIYVEHEASEQCNAMRPEAEQ
ncbi:hypothetical protein [Pseudoxanthomonas wuyuanensis]|uniref:Lipoprotein n=1 Tax=Pseudoxanthomonas wuyuanensis TaxID=1073196 RepID=A0A286DBN0_9GAMM|nr:hypothetical protein [Pseudoxanthomonas wuyuanensis]SOD56012.1 hypothetical protein SAMN06296416_108131 [Pseudoxanthomonas wuyuanensis]